MKHIMLDIKTMGTDPNAAIVAIGAVVVDFKNNCLGEEFYQQISLESAVQSGGIINASKVVWWLEQGDISRREIYLATAGIHGVCEAFSQFIDNLCDDHFLVCVWGNGTAFNNVLLACTYKRLGIEQPWKDWNDRCYRTVKKIHSTVITSSCGAAHNALDDAKAQALHLLDIYKINPGIDS